MTQQEKDEFIEQFTQSLRDSVEVTDHVFALVMHKSEDGVTVMCNSDGDNKIKNFFGLLFDAMSAGALSEGVLDTMEQVIKLAARSEYNGFRRGTLAAVGADGEFEPGEENDNV